MTNVNAEHLNYHHYSLSRYDNEIVRSIPGHKEMHDIIGSILQTDFKGQKLKVLELGPGTGITTNVLLQQAAVENYLGIDFSGTMLAGARERLVDYGLDFLLEDYSIAPLPPDNDLVLSVIGVHHQETNDAKRALFERVRKATKPGGMFLFGDLVTYRDPIKAATGEARHFHYLVENATSEVALCEWAYHHKFLNALAPLEDQIDWLKQVGFSKVEVRFEKFNTALICAR